MFGEDRKLVAQTCNEHLARCSVYIVLEYLYLVPFAGSYELSEEIKLRIAQLTGVVTLNDQVLIIGTDTVGVDFTPVKDDLGMAIRTTDGYWIQTVHMSRNLISLGNLLCARSSCDSTLQLHNRETLTSTRIKDTRLMDRSCLHMTAKRLYYRDCYFSLETGSLSSVPETQGRILWHDTRLKISVNSHTLYFEAQGSDGDKSPAFVNNLSVVTEERHLVLPEGQEVEYVKVLDDLLFMVSWNRKWRVLRPYRIDVFSISSLEYLYHVCSMDNECPFIWPDTTGLWVLTNHKDSEIGCVRHYVPAITTIKRY